MAKRRSIAEARDDLARLVHEAEEGEPVEITRRGKPVAVLLSLQAVERLRSGKTGFGDAVSQFREETDLEGLASEEALEAVRDASPGRAAGGR